MDAPHLSWMDLFASTGCNQLILPRQEWYDARLTSNDDFTFYILDHQSTTVTLSRCSIDPWIKIPTITRTRNITPPIPLGSKRAWVINEAPARDDNVMIAQSNRKITSRKPMIPPIR